MIVLDASVALAWLLSDEEDALAEAAAQRVLDEGALVPATFPAEVANAIRFAVKRKRLDAAEAQAILARLDELPIDIESQRFDLKDEWELALGHNLTIYDALYLALAKRKRLPLYTLDEDLLRAAKREKIAPAF